MSPDIQFQIECVSAELAGMLMEEYGWSIEKALDQLYGSQLFAKLNDSQCKLYYQGAVYLFDYLKEELETGHLS